MARDGLATHLLLLKGLLHLCEGGGEVANEVVLSSGVIVPDQALGSPGLSVRVFLGGPEALPALGRLPFIIAVPWSSLSHRSSLTKYSAGLEELHTCPGPAPVAMPLTPPPTLTLTPYSSLLIPTFRGRVSSQLQSEFRDTLKGSHTGLRLFFTTCRSEKTDLCGNPKGARPQGALESLSHRSLSRGTGLSESQLCRSTWVAAHRDWVPGDKPVSGSKQNWYSPDPPSLHTLHP